jgi:hypothetical protein
MILLMVKKKQERCGLRDLKKNKKIIQLQVLNCFNQKPSIENNCLPLKMQKSNMKLIKDNVIY